MLRAGFIGFGRMGLTHYSILNTHPSVTISSVCDHSSSMLSILKKYNKVATYTDYKKMLDEVPLDFVVVSTSTESHSEIIKYALSKNMHIFVEKPFALTVADAIETVSCLEGRNLVNQVGYVNRFNEVFVEVKRLLDAGVIGELINFSSEMYSATVLKDSNDNWRSKKKAGGGCMYEIASHCIDLVVYLLGKPDKVAGSIVKSIYSSDVDDLVSSTFIYKNGFSGTMTANWSDEAYRKPTNIVKIFGSKGKIVADKHAYKIYLKDSVEANGFQKGWNTRYITDFAKNVRFYLRGNEFTTQLDHFVDCIEKGRMNNVSAFSEALKTDLLIEEITMDALDTIRDIAEERSNTVPYEGAKRTSLLGKLFK